jgi:hypothetical protein
VVLVLQQADLAWADSQGASLLASLLLVLHFALIQHDC